MVAAGSFVPRNYIKTFPSPLGTGPFVAPTYLLRRTGEILRAPQAFMVALQQGFYRDALLSNPRTRHLITDTRDRSALKVGFRTYSDETLRKYHQALIHFLGWCELRGAEAANFVRFNYQNIEHYRLAPSGPSASLEDYENDQKDKRRPDVRSSNPLGIRTRIFVANAFLTFCLAVGYRDKPISPYMATANKAYLDRDELKPTRWDLPDIEDLTKFVRSQGNLRNRVASGLMVFGGLRVGDLLSMTIGDVPKLFDIKRVGAYRVALKVFGKGKKWRTTTIPFWVYDDLANLITSERAEVRKRLISRGLRLPMSKAAPVFVSTYDGKKFGQKLTPSFLRKIFEDSIFNHPHDARHAFAGWRLIELLGMRTAALHETPMTALLEMGLNHDVTETLKLEMGHKSIETTSIYLKWARQHIAENSQFLSYLARIEKAHGNES